jgi:hypothetical protein
VPEVAVAVGHGGERGMVVGWSGVRREKVERRDETSEGEGESRVWPEVFSSFSREKRQLISILLLISLSSSHDNDRGVKCV